MYVPRKLATCLTVLVIGFAPLPGTSGGAAQSPSRTVDAPVVITTSPAAPPKTAAELIVDAANHLAWPVLVLIILIILRPYLKPIFDRLKSFQAAGLHFELERGPTGLQFTTANRRIYYLPVYPQITWQNTGIRLQAGDHVQIDLYGWVSPGGLVDLERLREHMDAFVAWQGGDRPQPPPISELPQWPYTGPEGYRPAWYEKDTQISVIATHTVYSRDRFFEKDDGLTVKGLPHNSVIGTIRPDGATPKSALGGQGAYDWQRAEDRRELIDLSRPHSEYPVEIDVVTGGNLWVVINDVDECRWDNSGLFFMTVVVTRKEERRKIHRRRSTL